MIVIFFVYFTFFILFKTFCISFYCKLFLQTSPYTLIDSSVVFWAKIKSQFDLSEVDKLQNCVGKIQYNKNNVYDSRCLVMGGHIRWKLLCQLKIMWINYLLFFRIMQHSGNDCIILSLMPIDRNWPPKISKNRLL